MSLAMQHTKLPNRLPPETGIFADGYFKYRGVRWDAKAYMAVVNYFGHAHMSRRIFRTATMADAYGRRLADRAIRLVKAWQAMQVEQPAEEVVQ